GPDAAADPRAPGQGDPQRWRGRARGLGRGRLRSLAATPRGHAAADRSVGVGGSRARVRVADRRGDRRGAGLVRARVGLRQRAGVVEMIDAIAGLLSTSALAGTRASLTLLCLGLAARLELLNAPHPWMTS